MSHGRRTLVGLCTWGFLQAAHANEIRLIDPGRLAPAKGETLTLQFHVEGLQTGSRVRVQAVNGSARARPVTQSGLLVVDYRVSKLRIVPREVLTIKARSMGLDDTVEFQIQSDPDELQMLSFEPAWIESRPSGAAQVQVRVPRASEHPPWLRTSYGDLSQPSKSGDDWLWTWSTGSAPEASAVAAFLLMDPHHPERPAAWGALPMHITQSLTLQALPGYICELVQGDRRSEGVAVTPAGTLAMSVAVDPAQTAATVECENPVGQIRNYPVELQLGDVPSHVLGAVPPKIPADPEQEFSVHMLVLEPGGRPAQVSSIQMESSSGSLGYPEPTDFPGIWRTEFTPGPDDIQVDIEAQQAGHTQVSSTVTLPTARTLEVEATPSVVSAERSNVEVQFRTLPAGTTAPPGLPVVQTSGARTVARLRASSQGASQKLRLDRGQPGIWIQSSAPSRPTGLPAVEVAAWAPSPILLADGTSRRPVAVVVTDALGQGVPGAIVRLDLEASAEDARISPEVRAGTNGVAWAWVVAGTEDGPLVVRARIDGDDSTAALYALPADDSVCEDAPDRCQAITFVLDGDLQSRQRELALRERVKLSWIPFEDSPEEAEQIMTEDGSDLPASGSPEAGEPGSSTDPLAMADLSDPPQVGVAEIPRLRATVGIASLSHVYAVQAALGAAAPTPQQFQKGNLLEGNPLGTLGGTAHILVRAGTIQIEGNWLGGTTHLGTDSSVDPSPFHTGWLGLRKTWGLTSYFSGFVSGAADYQSFHVLMYDVSSPGELFLAELGTPGFRLATGLGWTNGTVLTELEFSEALVPWPVRSTGALRVEIQTTPWMVTRIGLDFSFRSARFSAGADELSLQDQFHVLSLGVGTSLP